MKILLLIFAITQIVFSKQHEENSQETSDKYFFSLLVTNIDSSITWYSNNFGFGVIDRNENQDFGLKQSNLKRQNIFIELIELNSALKPEEAIEDYDNRTRLIGIFKVGFYVSDFDEWLKNASNMNARFHGKVVIDPISGKRTQIVLDPDGNRVQVFEN